MCSVVRRIWAFPLPMCAFAGVSPLRYVGKFGGTENKGGLIDEATIKAVGSGIVRIAVQHRLRRRTIADIRRKYGMEV